MKRRQFFASAAASALAASACVLSEPRGRRLSADPDDPHFHPDALRARAFLDGAELRDCITADEMRGECICYVRGAPGRPVLAANGRRAREIRRGVVVIKLDAVQA